MSDGVRDFAREQGDNIRSTVRDGYDRLSPNNLDEQPVDDYAEDTPPLDTLDLDALEPDDAGEN